MTHDNELLREDPDPIETREWLESIQAVLDRDGPGRAHQLLENVAEVTRRAGQKARYFFLKTRMYSRSPIRPSA